MVDWTWPEYEPHFLALVSRKLTAGTVEEFLTDWTRLHDRAFEVYSRLNLGKDRNTADKEAEQRFDEFTRDTYPKLLDAEQQLKNLVLESGLCPQGFELPLRKMKAEAALFREENLPLYVEDERLSKEYSQLISRQTVTWDGKEVTVSQLRPVYHETVRERREAAWRLGTSRQLEDRGAINSLWQQLLEFRLRVAANAGCRDYREYRWQMMKRFDYTPEHCKQFHQAIEQVVVPAAARIYERRRRMLGIDSLRPWDLNVDVLSRPALRPFSDVADLKAGTQRILSRVDDGVVRYFRMMMEEDLLDLDNRKNKAPGGYCTTFAAAKRPFIFMNAVGLHRDLTTLLHESGHALHSFEYGRLPWFQQRHPGYEFSEVGSMSMELLALPYLARDQGGFYTADEAQRAVTEQLEGIVLFLPYMAVVDAFQHWVYENPRDAADPNLLDEQWIGLHQRFLPAVDWTELEDARKTIWQRQLHILVTPLYYVDYGVAQVGACQVWANSLKNRADTLASYKRALALGGTRSLPELYAAAGAKFAFDADTLATVVSLIESKLSE